MKQKNSACVTNREIAIVVGELHKLKLAVDAGQPRPEEREWRASIATMVGRVLTLNQTERIMHDCGFSRCDIFQSGGVAHKKRRTAEFEAMLEAVAKSVQTQQEDAKEMQRRLESFRARLVEMEAMYNRLAIHVNALLGRVREIGTRLDNQEVGKNV